MALIQHYTQLFKFNTLTHQNFLTLWFELYTCAQSHTPAFNHLCTIQFKSKFCMTMGGRHLTTNQGTNPVQSPLLQNSNNYAGFKVERSLTQTQSNPTQPEIPAENPFGSGFCLNKCERKRTFNRVPFFMCRPRPTVQGERTQFHSLHILVPRGPALPVGTVPGGNVDVG